MSEGTAIRPVKVLESDDGTLKYLWQLSDGQTVESVYLPLMNRGAAGPSMCISSQVGCAVRCTFCATGKNGLLRNLTTEEITGQVHQTLAGLDALPRSFDVSFMGMGEPLHNLPRVREACEALLGAYGDQCDVHFSLSSIGIARKIYQLAEFGIPVQLQISLHGTTDEVRERLIPTKSHTAIDELFVALRHYADVKNTVVNINYLLFDGVNDSPEAAGQLAAMISGDPRFRVKLSHYNPVEGTGLRPVDDATIQAFAELCRGHGLPTYVWESIGTDVGGGCGQLRSSEEAAGRTN
ncbi:radical SAM protein [Streptomonospora nanhaiensis]|uniref:23S rRNA (Adenine2503-C2)-methyltransferase n=1 Tax=Streptomonospora nanhaiensis TaxID=1323731 RepID=A0A853BKB0_9ACTN|nr:23S rRNA (adenine(2503)-C(2))-methyltransferase RlmN [Streptomonospora nanhaiensis]MBV2365329.1 23S rRNA (adenine(2503)-C(2))-methyltransferase RlmN [Streptomonospora nanhaiensis]MBX9389446.1 23S rRNA (adenine(2503)-C(2))-methyltransferase RlmN [Streptomonospora nanhaiensis]NYI95929.1 23S rRNA (adenine2503-C2)-methyltransferase [Streptomonospora nanhaiensis]